MDTERWSRLSAWHNDWLAADPQEREKLRDRLAAEQPELIAEADEIAAESASLDGFLEVPAFVVAAADLAADTPVLPAGTSVGPYRILELLAHGGMGDVYRATDVRLRRDVALKVLKTIGPDDPRRIARFEDEARITASLDHPNIVKVHDVGVFDGRPYFVAELLLGETLRSRLGRGALDSDEACRIVADVTRGLVAAHSAGLVHRDLKPENIFLTRAGVTKILDFGIAKYAEEEAPSGNGTTFTGALLGTAGYLAPEQIEGRRVDGRADLFTLGAILFEMVTGRRAFARDTSIDTLYAIVHDPAPDPRATRPDLPQGLCEVVARLLAKAPDARFQSAADLGWALEHLGILTFNRGGELTASRAPLRARLLPWVAAIAAAAAVAAWTTWPAAAPPRITHAKQFSWTLPEGLTLGSEPAVSPDGRRIVFVGLEGGHSRLFVRDLSSLNAVPVAGTEGATQPFWSPDSDAVGFFSRGRLMKAALQGGAPVELAPVLNPRGGTWGRSGIIVFQSLYRDQGLSRISASGGEVQAATLLDVTGDDTTHKWPVFLPDGVHFLYLVISVDESRRGIYVGNVADPPSHPGKPLFRADSGAVYVVPPGSDTGVLASVAGGELQVRPFDVKRLQVTGDPRTLGLNAAAATPHQPAMLGLSTDVLAIVNTPVPWGLHLAAVRTDGKDLTIRSERLLEGSWRLSPDGDRLVRSVVDPARGDPDLWVDDLARDTRIRVTTSRDLDFMTAWSPDGRRIAYRSGPWGKSHVSIAAADGTGVVQVLPCPEEPCMPTDWSRDGYLFVNAGTHVWRVPTGGGAAERLFTGVSIDRDARVSPDGKWVAYVSHEAGEPQVFVRSLAGPPRRAAVSSRGDQPVWRRDGRELYFVDPENRLHRVSVRAHHDGTLVLGPPVKVPIPAFGMRHFGTTYDVSADGTVYFPHPGDPPLPREVRFVLDWAALLNGSSE